MIEKVCVCAHECTKKQAIKTQKSTEEAQRREGKTATGHGLSGLSTSPYTGCDTHALSFRKVFIW